MNRQVIPIAVMEVEVSKQRKRQAPKGRRVDAGALEEVQRLRQLEHWHTGSMTRRATTLDALEPDPVALIHPLDLAAMGGQPGDVVTVESRRGRVELYARADEGSPRGAVFVPFCYYEAAINRLTNAALDPFAKIPEFKYCAIRVTLGGMAPPQGSYGGGQALDKLLKSHAPRAATARLDAGEPTIWNVVPVETG